MDYCTFDDVKLALNISGGDYDVKLSEFVTTASRWTDEHCHLPVNGFSATSDTVRYFGHSDLNLVDQFRVLRLDAPLLSITSIVNGNGQALAGGAYRLDPRNESPKWGVRILSGYDWAFATDGEIVITGKWGRSVEPPAPVREATIMFSAWIFKRYQAALQDATANFDLGQITYSESVPKQVKALLNPYVNRARLVG